MKPWSLQGFRIFVFNTWMPWVAEFALVHAVARQAHLLRSQVTEALVAPAGGDPRPQPLPPPGAASTAAPAGVERQPAALAATVAAANGDEEMAAATTASGAADSRPATSAPADVLQPEAGPASQEPPEREREESPCWEPDPDVPEKAHLRNEAEALINKSCQLRQELEVKEEEEEANAGPADSLAGPADSRAGETQRPMLRPCSLLRLPDGSWQLDTREHTVQKVAEVLELRLKACREQMACELTMQGRPPADVASLPIPPGYVLQGTFISKATREFKDRLAPALLAHHWERQTGTAAAVNFNSHKLRQAFAAYCHATYGDKRVFDWLLRYGGLDEHAADAMTQEVLRVRAADGAANSRPAAGAPDRAANSRPAAGAPRESGRDPNPNVAARTAASQRRAAARQDNYQLRRQGVLEEPGACDACGYYGALTACYWCQRAVCSWHQVPGYLVCVDCDQRHGRELRTPSHMPQDRRPPSHCDTQRCQRQDLRGQCITCHRYLCEGCSLDQPLTHCVVCGALSRGDGFVVSVALGLRSPL